MPGRFGTGVLIEYGRSSAGPNTAHNALPIEIATAEAAPEGFVPVNGAVLGRSPGVQGESALQVAAAGPEAGFATQAVTAPKLPGHVFSVHLKGAPGTVLQIRAAIEGGDQPLARRDVTLTGDWQQEALSLEFDVKTVPWQSATESTPPLVFTVVAKQPATFLADALMLETRQGYANRRGPTTWIEPGKSRDGEILQIGRLGEDDVSGSIAFWAQLRGQVDWRTLFTLGDGPGWQVPLRLDVRDNKRAELLLPNTKQTARFPLPDPFAWHHYVIAWNAGTTVLYLDGKEVAKLEGTPGLANAGAITLGGVAENRSPALRSDAVFDDFGRWNRALSADEVSQLAARTEPLDTLFAASLAVEDLAPVKVFARDLTEYAWPLVVVNRTARPVSGLVLSYGVPGLSSLEKTLPDIPPSGELEVTAPFAPALLLPGEYEMRFTFRTADGHHLKYPANFSVVKARVPLENAQVVSWRGHSQAMADAGVTVGGLAGGLHGPAAYQVEEATRRGLYTQLLLSLSASGEQREDHFIDAAGRQHRPDQSTPSAQASIRDQTEQLASALERMPDVKFAILNCEHQWIWNVDFREPTVALVRERFGLDLDRWRQPPVTDAARIQFPYGRLNPAPGGIAAPASGIIALNDPFYAYSRWWQSSGPGNEVFLNDKIARLLRERVPRVQTIAEPALRRPSVRAFLDQDIVNEWFYFPDPGRAVFVQEDLTAAIRGTRTQITGMPQFLLKPGMAAPYGGMPTPTLFREAAWHCLVRPSVGLTYWNLWGALEKGDAKYVMTQAEIDGLLGPQPSWKDAETKIEVRGEHSSVFLWIPELPEEIRRLHSELVHPLGGLWPRWRNAPRRVAIYKSFAGQLFNKVRWTGPGALGEAVAAVNLPFDILYDQDFENSADVLDSYTVVAIPEAPVITSPAADALRAFTERGGIVVVDQFFKAALPGIVRLDFRSVGNNESLRRAERELLAQYGSPSHVLYIEGMEEARRQLAVADGPVAKVEELIRTHATGEIRTDTTHVALNLLEAGAARYLTAVNGLARPGPSYGHFGRVRDQGIEQTAGISIHAGLGNAAYRLDTGKPIDMGDEADGRRSLSLPLMPSGGAVVLLLPRPIAAIKMAPMEGPKKAHSKPWNLNRLLDRVQTFDAAPGQWVQASASLIDDNGQPVPGVVPAKVQILGPDGQASDFSRYDAFIDGQWTYKIPIALNQVPGLYQLTVTESASGLQARTTWNVK